MTTHHVYNKTTKTYYLDGKIWLSLQLELLVKTKEGNSSKNLSVLGSVLTQLRWNATRQVNGRENSTARFSHGVSLVSGWFSDRWNSARSGTAVAPNWRQNCSFAVALIFHLSLVTWSLKSLCCSMLWIGTGHIRQAAVVKGEYVKRLAANK